ncbi:hypothetical protein [Parasphingorhabdus sp.]|uniref:hypothetical protein n=1 Tax=Parasphingorhabdus sp. TaxID=2709688 RepID=UPI003264BD86
MQQSRRLARMKLAVRMAACQKGLATITISTALQQRIAATSIQGISNMKFFRMFILMLLTSIGLSSAANAGGVLQPPQIITHVSFQQNGFIIYADGWPNPNNCDTAAGVMLLATDSNYDKAFALLLTAYSTGKKVSGYSDGCTLHDGVSYNSIRGSKYLVVR